MMKLWRFLDYQTEDGRNLTREWYETQDAFVQVAFDATLRILRAESDWSQMEEEFKVLTRAHSGLCEIRFYVDVYDRVRRRYRRRRFRPVGIWRPEERVFILILGCEKSRMNYAPHDAFGWALRLKADLEAGKGELHEHVW